MIGVEQARGGDNNGVIYDHFAPMTWPICVTVGCTERVDPWDHQTRCVAHRPDPERIDVELAMDRAGVRRFVCPDCQRISYHPTDVLEGYCDACHAFTRPRASA